MFFLHRERAYVPVREHIVDLGQISSSVRASSAPLMGEMQVELDLIKGAVGVQVLSGPLFILSRLSGLVPKTLTHNPTHTSAPSRDARDQSSVRDIDLIVKSLA